MTSRWIRRQTEFAPRAREESRLGQSPQVARWNWAARAAGAWALLFALQSLVAAILVTCGSAFAADTFAAEFARLARERDVGFIAVLWVAVVAKTLVGMLALAPTRSWGRWLPRRPLVAVTYAVGAIVLLYGVAGLIQAVLMKTGVSPVPTTLGAKALSWHLWVWDPYWIAGGVLLLIAARTGSRCRGQQAATRARRIGSSPVATLGEPVRCHRATDGGHGDLYATIQIRVPKRLSSRERELGSSSWPQCRASARGDSDERPPGPSATHAPFGS